MKFSDIPSTVSVDNSVEGVVRKGQHCTLY
jgi:hypothetical protein